ncbi:MAG TPA: hypothetical protein VNQ77_16535 [Frankiaceae bacterium]|nr:hypothetical protein [Frankiaceae bacterium]
MLIGATFAMFFLAIMALVLVPLGFLVYSLVEVARAPEQAFGPPWDNGKNAWLIGLAVAFAIPAGTIVGPILWWTQGHKALRARQLVPKPFWAPARTYYPPAQGYPAQQPVTRPPDGSV